MDKAVLNIVGNNFMLSQIRWISKSDHRILVPFVFLLKHPIKNQAFDTHKKNCIFQRKKQQNNGILF